MDVPRCPLRTGRSLGFVLAVLLPAQVGGIASAMADGEPVVVTPPPAVADVVPPAPTAPAPTSTTTTPAPPPVAAPVPSAQSQDALPAPTPPVPAAAPRPRPVAAEPVAERLERAFAAAVPPRWRSSLPVTVGVVAGGTSWAHPDGRILISSRHAEGDLAHLVDVVAHEFGHQIAFRHGSGDYSGAGPAGWPAPARLPEEAWADCVQTAFTNRRNPSHGLPPCDGPRLDWVRRWLTDPPP